jgi:hypothetical protein
MTDHMEPSFGAMAVCNGAALLFAIFITLTFGIDPMPMVMG